MSIIMSIISARTSSDASGRETGKGNQKGHLYYPTLPPSVECCFFTA